MVLVSDPRINNDSNDNSNVDDKNNYFYIGCPFDIVALLFRTAESVHEEAQTRAIMKTRREATPVYY